MITGYMATSYVLEDVRKTYKNTLYIETFGYRLQSFETMILFIALEQVWE
jgi:hypothetical protein